MTLLIRYNSELKTFKTDNLIIDKNLNINVWSFFEDEQNNVWFGTDIGIVESLRLEESL